MKQKPFFIITLLLTALAGGSYAQSVNQWKYLPEKILKTPKIPAVINPKLPLDTRVKLAALNPSLQASVARAALNPALLTNKTQAALTQPTAPAYAACPEQFASFVRRLDRVMERKWVSPYNEKTLQALGAVRRAVLNYNLLPDSYKPRINWLVIYLDKLSAHLKTLPAGQKMRLIYRGETPAPGEIPQADNFLLEIKQWGAPNLLAQPDLKKRPWRSSFALSHNAKDRNIVQGVVMFPDFTPELTRNELLKTLRVLTPYGYRLRMGSAELGLRGEDRTNFRQGTLHLHIETSNPTAGPVPIHRNYSLFVSAKPYAGVIDPRTRQIVLQNNDKTIAQNYLTLFEPYLDPQGRAALQHIIAENH